MSVPVQSPGGWLERHTLALGYLVLLAIALLVGLALFATRGLPTLEHWPVSAVVPADGPPLRSGDEVRVNGTRFGAVTEVEPHPDGARVRIELDRGPVGAEARVRVRVRGLSGTPFVELHRGDLSRPLARESIIPRARTSAATELVDVLDVFDPPARRSLRRVAPALGGGLLGRGDDLNATLADLGPTLSQGEPLLRAVSPRTGSLRDAVFNARRVITAVAPPGSRELERLVPAGAATFEVLAVHSADVESALALLPAVEAEAARTLPVADPLLDDARAALVELRAGARALRDSLPAVNALLRREAGLRSASRLARAAEPVLADSRPLLLELREPITALPVLLRSFRPLVTELSRFDTEIRLLARQLRVLTARRSAAGRASGRRVFRTVPVFTCARARDPYPEPGESRRQRRPCRR